jgi:hypothetical protein
MDRLQQRRTHQLHALPRIVATTRVLVPSAIAQWIGCSNDIVPLRNRIVSSTMLVSFLQTFEF